MNLWLRLFWIYLGTLFRERLSILEPSDIRLAVCPGDLDVYGHMNNGRYLTLMDLGRIDLILRTGLGRAAKKNRWFPLVGTVNIRYRQSLQLFEPFHIRTRIVGWDGKWFYIEQTFWRRRKEMARAHVRGLFRGPHGNVAPAEVLRSIGAAQDSPVFPKNFAVTSLDPRQ